VTDRIGLLGGTGPLGRGLALRLALAGHAVELGSRDAGRAAETAQNLKERAQGGDLTGSANAEVAQRCGVVILTLPYQALHATLHGLAPALDGKLVVSTVNALEFGDGPRRRHVAAGSAAEEAAHLLPGARMTAAFHTVSASKLEDPDAALEGDVAVCGDDRGDRQRVVELAEGVGLRGLHAGALHHSEALEALTAMIISINRLYRTSAGIAFTNVDPSRLR